MGDFEDTFGAGADAAEIVERFAQGVERERELSGEWEADPQGNPFGNAAARRVAAAVRKHGFVPASMIVDAIIYEEAAALSMSEPDRSAYLGFTLGRDDWFAVIAEMRNMSYLYGEQGDDEAGDLLSLNGDLSSDFDDLSRDLDFKVVPLRFPSVGREASTGFEGTRRVLLNALDADGRRGWYREGKPGLSTEDDLSLMKIVTVRPADDHDLSFLDSNRFMFLRYLDRILSHLFPHGRTAGEGNDFLALERFYVFEKPFKPSTSRMGW